MIQRGSSKAKDKTLHQWELKDVAKAIQKLLSRIEDAVPLINLAISASGANLSSTLPTTVSPSRLLQASTFLTAGDTQYAMSPSNTIQIGPTFTLSMYMLFQGHVRPQNEEDIRESTWKEVVHKANVKLLRVSLDAISTLPDFGPKSTPMPATNGDHETPPATPDLEGSFPSQLPAENRADEFAYQIMIVEDLDDDRVHTFEDGEPQPEVFGDVETAGIREAIPVHEISKIFYADTGKILNIGSDGETNSPVLLLKRDVNAVPPRRRMERSLGESSLTYGIDIPSSIEQSIEEDENDSSRLQLIKATQEVDTSAMQQNPWRLPPDLDPEWIALEVYTEDPNSDAESDTDTSSRPPRPSRTSSVEPSLTSTLSRIHLSSPAASPSTPQSTTTLPTPSLPPIRTSLSRLETILRLLSLQQFQQTPHLSIPDELLTFFLSESAATGADGQERKRIRQEARRRVGFDPYDESPVKRRGEEYQYRRGEGKGWSETEQGNYEDEDEPYTPERHRESSQYRDTPSYRESPSQRYEQDEGYGTRRWTPASPSPLRGTPPLLLKNRSRSGTPGSQGRLRDPIKKGSPLARQGSGLSGGGGSHQSGTSLGNAPSAGREDGKVGDADAEAGGEKPS